MGFYATDRPWGDVLPRYAFLESLFADKTVLEIGCGAGSGAVYLASRGAKQVVGIERQAPLLERVQQEDLPSNVTLRTFDGHHLDDPSASYDVVIGFDLALRMDPALLSEIERVLKPTGYLVTGLPNRGHHSLIELAGQTAPGPVVTFEQFVASLQDRFGRVSVIGQSPFFGFSIGWLGAETQDLPLEMDTGFLPDDEEESPYFLIVCGREAIGFEYQSLIQLPFGQVVQDLADVRTEAPAKDSGLLQELKDKEARLQELNRERIEESARLGTLQQERDDLRAQIDELPRLRTKLENRDETVVQLQRRMREIENQLREAQDGLQLHAERAHLLDQRSAENQRLADQLTARVKELETEGERLTRENHQLESERERSAQELQRFESEHAELRQARMAAEQQRDALKTNASRLAEEVGEKTNWLETARAEIDRLEGELKLSAAALERERAGFQQRERLLRDQTSRRSEDESALRTLRSEYRELQKIHGELTEETNRLRRQWEASDADRANLQAAAEQRLAQLEEARRFTERLQEDEHRKSEEILALKEQIGALEGQVADLRSQRDRTHGELEQSRSDLAGLQERIAHLQQDREAGLAERELLQSELNDRHTENQQLRHRLSDETRKRVELEQQMTSQLERSREMESDLTALINRLENEQEREHDWLQYKQDLEKRLTDRHQDLDDFREKVDELTHELFKARRHEEDLSAALELMRSAVVSQERVQEELRVELDHLRLSESDANRELEHRLHQTETELISARDRLEDQTSILERTISGYDRLRAEKNHLHTELDRVQSRLAEALDRLAASGSAGRQVIDLERELAWYRGEEQRMKTAAADAQAELAQLRDELDLLHEDLNQAHQSLLQSKEEQLQLIDNCKSLQHQLASAEVSDTRLRQEIDKLEKQIAEYKNDIQVGQSRLNEVQIQNDERARDLEQTSRKLEEAAAHNRLLSEELDRLRIETREREEPLRESLAMSQEREKTLQSRLASLQEQMGELESRTSSELASLGEQIRRREEQMQSLTGKLLEESTAKQASIARCQARESELASLRENSATRLMELEEQRDALEKRIKDMLVEIEEQTDACQARDAQARMELAGMQDKIAELQAEVFELREESQAKEFECEEYSQRLEKQSAEMQVQLEQSAEDARRLQSIGQERERALEQQAREVQERERALEQQAREVQERERALERQTREAQERERALERQAREAQERERALEQQTREAQERERALEQQAHEAQERERALEQQTREAQERERALEQQAREVQERERAFENQVDDMQDMGQALKDQVRAAAVREKAQEDRISELEDQLSKAQPASTDVESSRAVAVRLEAELRSARKRIGELESTMANFRQEAAEREQSLHAQVINMRREMAIQFGADTHPQDTLVDDLKQRLAESQNHVHILEKELAMRTEQITRLRDGQHREPDGA